MAERDAVAHLAMQNHVGDLLRILGMSDHARPESPAAVMEYVVIPEVKRLVARLRAPVDPPERVSAPLVYTCFECHAGGVESDDGYCEVNEGLAAVCSRECWEAFAARYDEPVARVSEASALRDLTEKLLAAYEDERAMPSPMGDALIRSARRALEDTKGEAQ